MVGGSRYKLGEYDSLEQAKIALDIVSQAMHTGSNLCQFPSDSDIKAHAGHIDKNKSVTEKKRKAMEEVEENYGSKSNQGRR